MLRRVKAFEGLLCTVTQICTDTTFTATGVVELVVGAMQVEIRKIGNLFGFHETELTQNTNWLTQISTSEWNEKD